MSLRLLTSVVLVALAVVGRASEPSELELRLARDPDDPELLLEVATARKKGGDKDGELAALYQALEANEQLHSDDEEVREKRQRLILARLGVADKEVKALWRQRDQYLAELSEVLRLYGVNQKRFRNALDVAGRILFFRPDHSLANQIVHDIRNGADEELERYAAEALARRDLRRPRGFRREWSRAHASWDQAGTAETRGYVVRSNIGYETLQRAATTLEQISFFYREFYGTSYRGTTDVFLYRTREEFERYAAASDLDRRKSVRGFLSTSVRGRRFAFELYSYDPLDDGLPREFLDEVLFHEASHQYMKLASSSWDTPSWLDEGMACYFEGARVDAEGNVEVGLPAYRRLSSLVQLLGRDARPLRGTIAARQLSAEQYAVAWGLVYYLHHCRTDDGALPYRACLKEAIGFSRELEGEPAQVFHRAVLQKVGVPLDEFERDWVAWIRILDRFERDATVAARLDFERAQEWLEGGEIEAAQEAFVRARLRDPDDPRPYVGLARILASAADDDRALLAARRAREIAAHAGDEASIVAASALVESLDRGGVPRLDAAERKYREKVMKHVDRLLADGRPKAAVEVARRFLDSVLGGEGSRDVARVACRADPGAVARVLVPFDGESLFGLIASQNDVSVADGGLVASSSGDRPATVFLEEPIAPAFDLEGELAMSDTAAVLGFCATLPGARETRGFAIRAAGGAPPSTKSTGLDSLRPGHVAELRRERRLEQGAIFAGANFIVTEGRPISIAPEKGVWTRFRLRRSPDGHLSLELNDAVVAEGDGGSRAEREVTVGFLVAVGEVRLRNLRVVEHGRL